MHREDDAGLGRWLLQLAREALHQPVERDHLAARALLVEAGQRQQVVAEAGQALARRADAAGAHPHRRGIVRLGQQQVGVRLHDGDRVAQLVGGVGGEAALAAEGVVEPLDHVVEGVRQPPQLVVGAAQADAALEVRRADVARHARDPVDRRQRAARDHPADQQRRDEEEADRRERVVLQPLERVLVDLALQLLRRHHARLGAAHDRRAVGHRAAVQRVRQREVDAQHQQPGQHDEDGGVEDGQPQPQGARDVHQPSRTR